MTNEPNALAQAASAYLRSAMHQPVRWYPWGPEAFAAAKAQDKPILLDIGAVWCHWCHVMDRESYENAAIAQVINRHYIAIKVDRDERPDVDARYQAAVQTMAGQGGWPLTALLTSDGSPFFGGTYFAPEDSAAGPGLRRVLETMAGVWKERRKELTRTASEVLEAIDEAIGEEEAADAVNPSVIDEIVGSALGSFDAEHGGFGDSAKFPHPAALDLLLDVAARTGNTQVRHAAVFTLEAMARGGVYDQLGGGFHRYAVDERWAVPHFEKLLYDNASLLANYAHAFQTFVEPEFARITLDLMRWMDTTLSDREQGGFYASQDADHSANDDGDYFTWTRAEMEAVLRDSPGELRLAVAYWNVREQGDMHHNQAKCVLHVARPLAEVAESAGIPAQHAATLLRSAHAKLLGAREQRLSPMVDRTLYTSWNALAIAAYFAAADALERQPARAFALKTLNRLLRESWNAEGRILSHVMAYADGRATRDFAAGVLEDYAYTVHACLDAWQATAELRYYSAAAAIADAMIERFADRNEGGFFDTDRAAAKQGALRVRRKPLQDAPTPGGNASAAAALLRLHALNGREELRSIAEDTLVLFAGVAGEYGLYAASYALALEHLLLPSVQVVVIGRDDAATRLAATASARYAVNKVVLRLLPEQLQADALPPVLAETLPGLPLAVTSFAVVCKGTACLPPVTEPEALLENLAEV